MPLIQTDNATARYIDYQQDMVTAVFVTRQTAAAIDATGTKAKETIAQNSASRTAQAPGTQTAAVAYFATERTKNQTDPFAGIVATAFAMCFGDDDPGPSPTDPDFRLAIACIDAPIKRLGTQAAAIATSRASP